MRIRTGRIDAEVRFLAPDGVQYAPIREFAVRATPGAGNPGRPDASPGGMLEAYPLLEAFRSLEDVFGLAEFMNEHGPLLPVLANREVVWGLDTLLGELDAIDAAARTLLEASVGRDPTDEPTRATLEPRELGAAIADGIERLADLHVETDAEGGTPRLAVATSCLCGLAWLLLGAWAAALDPAAVDDAEFTVVRCTNDRCRRPYAKVGKIAYCEACRASGADLAYQRRRRYAADRAEGLTADGAG